jgi:pyruvate dehydrogenase E1 component
MADDLDVLETREWLDALDSFREFEGPDRANFLLGSLIDAARCKGARFPTRRTRRI